MVLITDMDMRPITIEVEEILAIPLDDLVTAEIDLVFPTEAVILDQKLGAEQVEHVPQTDIATYEIAIPYEIQDQAVVLIEIVVLPCETLAQTVRQTVHQDHQTL